MSDIERYDPDAIESVREMLDEGNPAFWNFEEDGHEVIGYAVRKEVGQTANGACEILVLDVGGHLRSVWLFHTALISKLQRMQPQVGDLVGIRRLGEREPQGGGRPYVDYNVVVLGKQGKQLDWATPAQELPVVAGEVVDEEPPPVQSSSW